MLERRIGETGFGFLPTAKDWRIGCRNYLYFLPVGAALAYLLNAGHLVTPSDPLKLTGYFIGFLFGLTLAEEFFFRGVLQQWIEDWTWSRRTALILTSILFGGVHLWFRHFPNWRWVIIAGTPGLVLRPRAQSGRQHTRRHGDPHPGDHDMAGLLRSLRGENSVTDCPTPSQFRTIQSHGQT